jgi:hypothetical protein
LLRNKKNWQTAAIRGINCRVNKFKVRAIPFSNSQIGCLAADTEAALITTIIKKRLIDRGSAKHFPCFISGALYLQLYLDFPPLPDNYPTTAYPCKMAASPEESEF